MALRIYIEVSEGGIGDSAFSPLTDFEDDGNPFSFNDDAAGLGLTPGKFYLYRARRYDPDVDLFSEWSNLAGGRAPYPARGNAMIDTCDVTTGSDERLGIGLEPFPGVVVESGYQLKLVNGSIGRTHGRRYSRQKRNKQTMRRNVRLGRVSYSGTFTVEVSAEGGFPIMMLAAHEVSTSNLTGPTRYKHAFLNGKTCRTVTLVHQIGNVFKVYPGAKVASYTMTPDLTGDDVLIMDVTFTANAELIYNDEEALLNMDTAVDSTLGSYVPEDALITIGGVDAGLRTFTATFTRDLTAYETFNGTHGAAGHFSKSGDPGATATSFFSDSDLKYLWQTFGYSADPADNFGLADNVITTPVRALFSPPSNGSFVNDLEFLYPSADIATSEAADGRNEAVQNLTITPIDASGNSPATDYAAYITNSYSNTTLLTPGIVIDPTEVKTTKAFNFLYGVATGVPTTTSSASAANPHLSSVDDAYNGRKLRYVTGTLVGVERLITDYVGSSRTFTTAAFGGAPAAGDAFVII